MASPKTLNGTQVERSVICNHSRLTCAQTDYQCVLEQIASSDIVEPKSDPRLPVCNNGQANH
jgi:hypothetical protein